jgi:hypothetical protein
MTEAVRTLQLLPSSKIIRWFWQSHSNSLDGKENVKWERYSDFENEHIEEAYQRKDKQVGLNDHVINFEHNKYFKKDDRNQQCSVKREEVAVNHYGREARFSYPERANKSFVPNSGGMSPFIEQWRNKNLDLVYGSNLSDIVEVAAQGRSYSSASLHTFSLLLQESWKKANF